MPLIRNNGRYGQLGNWGRKTKRISKKRLLMIISLLVLGTIFSISRNGGPIGFVNGDYNSSYNHTRTPIFADTIFNPPPNGATFDFLVGAGAGAGGITGCGAGCTSPQTYAHAVTNGEALIVIIDANAGCGTFTVTDSQTNTYTTQICSSIPTIQPETMQIITAFASSTGTDTWTFTFAGTVNFFGTFGGYTGVGSISGAQTTQSTTTSAAGTRTLTTTSFAGLMFGHFQFWNNTGGSITPTGTSRQSYTSMNSPIFYKAGSNEIAPTSLSWSWAGMSCPVACFTNIGSINLVSISTTPLASSNVRWNYNQTCVVLNTNGFNPAFAKFDYSKGSSGSGGANCSSADIMISKAPVNFQTASGRMLEMVIEWLNNAAGTAQNVTFIARTNGTLPSFTQNYNPFTDPQARMIWTTTTAGSANVPSSAGSDSLYVARDQGKSVQQESLTNDLVIQGKTGLNSSLSTLAFAEQAVVNFTGPTNFLLTYGPVIVSSSTSNMTASSFQFGVDYYLVVMADFNTISSPCMGCNMEFVAPNAAPPPVTVKPFGIFSVPASCNDPVNTSPCSLATATPVFQFNPLDPSSWGNAIIKGLLWVFTVGVPLAFGVASQVIITEVQLVGNFIGQHLGWGNLGDNIVTFFGGVSSFFGQIGTAFAWLGSLVSSAISVIGVANLFTNPYFTGLANVLNDFKNAIGSSLIISMINQIAFWFPTSYMIILITFYFLNVFMNGLKGFFDWIHLVRWSSFQLYDLFAKILDAFIALITAILGRISVISPGHKFPKLPHLNAGPLPKISFRFDDIAFFDDPTAWFLAFTGFVFTMMWAGTSAAGLPANTQTIIQSMSTLFLTLFGVGFMILILYIPGFLLAKLYEKGILNR